MKIKNGYTLDLVDSDRTAKVLTPTRVEFDGKKMSLTNATRIARKKVYVGDPTRYWKYRGRSLFDIYEETFPRDKS